MKVGFFTYGDVEMGMGHVFRCLRFAKYLIERKGATVVFEIYDSPEVRSVFLNQPGMAVVFHSNYQLPTGPWDILFVDQLQVSSTKMCELRRNCGTLVSIDDVGKGRYEADFAFNSLYACPLPKPSTSSTKCFSGLLYLMLDPAFSGCVTTPRENKIQRLLVTQGGSDTYRLCPPIVQALQRALNYGIEIHVLVGAGANHDESYRSQLAALLPAERIHVGVGDMPTFLKGFDLAVTSIGMSAFELAALGIPFVMFTGEKKELETGALIHRTTGAPLCSLASSTAVSAAVDYVTELIHDHESRRKLSFELSRLVDACGFKRITDLTFQS